MGRHNYPGLGATEQGLSVCLLGIGRLDGITRFKAVGIAKLAGLDPRRAGGRAFKNGLNAKLITYVIS